MRFMADRNLPIDEIAAKQLAAELLDHPLLLGCLTITNALQWELQYRRVIELAGTVDGILRIT